MAHHDQRLKTLLKEFIRDFFRLFLPQWFARLDFSRVEWLEQEVFPDPPTGKRGEMDLLAKIAASGQQQPQWLSLLHVEVDSGDHVAPLRRRMHWYYTCARHKHDLPVLPIALYLGVALEGLGVDIYREDYSPPPADGQEPLSWQVLQFRFNYIGLPGLDALEHLQQDNLLALALVGLMRIPPGRKAWIKAEALRKIYAAGESEIGRAHV